MLRAKLYVAIIDAESKVECDNVGVEFVTFPFVGEESE